MAYAVDSTRRKTCTPRSGISQEMLNELELIFPIKGKLTVEDLEKLDRDEMKARSAKLALEAYEAKEAEIGPEIMRQIESHYIMLPIIDRLWVDHLYVMDAFKTGIGLRGYGQKDPRVEYEKEAYEIFEDLKNNIADEAIKMVFRIQIDRNPQPQNSRKCRHPHVPRFGADRYARDAASGRRCTGARLRTAPQWQRRAAAGRGWIRR